MLLAQSCCEFRAHIRWASSPSFLHTKRQTTLPKRPPQETGAAIQMDDARPFSVTDRRTPDRIWAGAAPYRMDSRGSDESGSPDG